MRILYIITSADRGGAQKYVLDLAGYFHGEIAAGTEHSNLFEDAQHANIPTHKLRYLKRAINPLYDTLALFELYRLIRRVRPDIVHVNSSKAGILGSIAGKLAGSRVIFTAHGFFFFERQTALVKAAYTILEWFASLFRDHIIAVSETDRALAIQHNIIHTQKVTTIHNGIAPISFLARSEARSILHLDNGKIVIGTIAQLYHRKGLDIYLDALSTLPRDIQSAITALIIGEGPERLVLEKQIRDLGLTHTVQLAGNIPNASLLLPAFDMFMLPSRQEGFPYVLLEAMQAGLPIITTRVGGVAGALGDAGIIVEPENSQHVAAAIQNMISDADTRSTLGATAKKRASLFTQDALFANTQKIYESVGNTQSLA